MGVTVSHPWPMWRFVQSLRSLDDFLKQAEIDDCPAWEFWDGTVSQKPMSKTRHALLQKRLLTALDASNADNVALPELRCTFGGRSLVPNIVVVY